MDLRVKSKKLSLLVALPLFAIVLLVYAHSLPESFNTRPENDWFFDSDGFFITDQFKKNSAFTHNDHLLYHVLAKTVVRVVPSDAGAGPNVVGGHLALSLFFGAMGIASLYLGGTWLGGDPRATLASAVL